MAVGRAASGLAGVLVALPDTTIMATNQRIKATLRRFRRREINDEGFGTSLTGPGRLVNKDGTYNIHRRGRLQVTPYQALVLMSWRRFWVVVLGSYFLLNALFTIAYLLVGPEEIAGLDTSSFGRVVEQLFYFSVQTFTTVGYGAIHPVGQVANLVASVEALSGFIFFGIFTGVTFARVSRPIALILFSRHALIAPYQGMASLQFRLAAKHDHKLTDVEATVIMTWVEDEDGRRVRRFRGLELERSRILMFPLNWTVVHPIDQQSPLAGLTREQLEAMQAEFLVFIKGYDETFAQTVHASTSYLWDELKWGRRFLPMYETLPNGHIVLDLEAIDACAEAPLPE